jgi:hypothetical protein
MSIAGDQRKNWRWWGLLALIALTPALLMALIVQIQAATMGPSAFGSYSGGQISFNRGATALNYGVLGVCLTLVLGVLLAVFVARLHDSSDTSRTSATAVASANTPPSNGSRSTSERAELVSLCVELDDNLRVQSPALRSSIRQALGRAGVVAIEVQQGESFDPQRHQAYDAVATTRAELDNTIESTQSVGYSDHGRIVRLPTVSVFRAQNDRRHV